MPLVLVDALAKIQSFEPFVGDNLESTTLANSRQLWVDWPVSLNKARDVLKFFREVDFEYI